MLKLSTSKKIITQNLFLNYKTYTVNYTLINNIDK